MLGFWAAITGYNATFPLSDYININEITTINNFDWTDWSDLSASVFRFQFLYCFIGIICMLIFSCFSFYGQRIPIKTLSEKLNDAQRFMLNRNPGDPLPQHLDDHEIGNVNGNGNGPAEGDPNHVALQINDEAFPREGPEPAHEEPIVVLLDDDQIVGGGIGRSASAASVERKYDDEVGGEEKLDHNFERAPSRAKFSSAPSVESAKAAQDAANAAKAGGADEDDDKVCVICCDKQKDTAFLPCAHYCVCFSCANSIMKSGVLSKTCPVCREPIEAISRFK